MENYYFIIDGNSFMHRSYNAIPKLTNQKGFPTNAITGTLNMINAIINKYNPENIVVAFDVGGKNFRHESYSEYKATRGKMEDDLKIQFPVIKEILDNWGIKRLEVKGVEADDSMGTLAKEAEKKGYKVVITTSDKDMKQLVTENILILDTKDSDKKEPYGVEGVYEKEGVYPENITDKLALMGDSSDNIPGVAGIGEKTAIRLIETHGSAIEAYENIEKEKETIRKKLLASEEDYHMSAYLVEIDTSVKIESFEYYQKEDMNNEKMADLLYEYGMKKLIKSLSLEEELEKKKVTLDCIVNKITNLKEVNIEKEMYIHYDSKNIYIYINENKVSKISIEDVSIKDLEELFLNKEVYTFNSKELIKYINNKNIVFNDISILDYVNKGASKEKSLQDLYENYLSQPIELEKPEYNVIAIKKIKEEILKENIDYNILKMENKLNSVLSFMEKSGIVVDLDGFKKYEKEIEEKLKVLEKDIFKLTEQEFNINSTKQLAKVLFEDLKIITKKKSTAEDILKKLSIQHPVIDKIIYFKKLAKLKSTYITGLIKHITTENKIHTTYNQTIANTGRLSAKDPNLQSIPIKTEDGKLIRKNFIGRKGYKIVALDYSQIELRVLAHMCNELNLISAFNNNVDIHSKTASDILGKDIDEVTSEERRIFKGINFGLIYGMSSRRLAEELNIDKKLADQYKEMYFEKYNLIKPFMENELSFAKKNGFVNTLLNRKIYIEGINAKQSIIRSHAERSANNASIQGTAAEIIKKAMINVFEYISNLKNNEANLLLQIHDELVIEVKEEFAESISIDIKNIMEDSFKLKVPLEVDYKIADNWLEAH